MKKLELEQIYADSHSLDASLASGEAVEVVRDGQAIAQWVPRPVAVPVTSDADPERPPRNYRERFLQMWGPHAFESKISVADEFEELRRERDL